MKQSTVTMNELFTAVTSLTGHEFIENEEFIQPFNIQIPDENGEYKDVVCLITKKDIVRTITTDDGRKCRVANKHRMYSQKDGMDCTFAYNLKYGDKLITKDRITPTIIYNEIDSEEIVFDLQLNTTNHLYQDADGFIHHNTMAARSASQVMKKLKGSEFFYFNLGASQDPRTFLIGNVQFNPESGTYFSESLFVKAIQTPNAVILLDELTRAHPEAANILMTVLDAGQRYLRLDEIGDSSKSTVHVADNVSFIATANIGAEYTGTKIMDRAIKDRFTMIEMDTLTAEEERGLLTKMFPFLHEKKINAIAEVAESTRIEVKKEDSRISTIVSTRATVEMAELMTDGFTFTEASSIVIAPLFDAEGGTESERAYIMSIIQKYNEIDDIKDIFNINDEPTPDVTEESEADAPVDIDTEVTASTSSDGLFTTNDIK